MDLQTIFVNGTSTINIHTEPNFESNLIFILIPLIATSIIGWKTIEYSRKQHERTAMKDIFGILGETPHKSAEENIRDAYKRRDLESINATYNSGAASVVRRNYDQIGSMLSSKLVPTTQYYQTFGVLTIVSFLILKDRIEQERKEHKFHMAHFTNLAIDCFDFWDKQKGELKIKITNPNGTPITKEMLGNKIPLPK